MVKVGIIGGSGIDNPEIMQDSKKIKVHTPYGSTSDLVMTGKVKGVDVVVIPRHGDSHRIYPSNVNYRANIYAMKELRVTHIIAPTACGSLREEIKPGDLVFIDQFIDRTTKRHQTFYEGVEVCHISMAEPFCNKIRKLLVETAKELNYPYHEKGTMVTIEGPRFSTKAESKLFRSWGCDTINMTTVPEAVLAREAGICYQPIAMSTDYDCWHQSEEKVTTEIILRIMKNNSEKVKQILINVIPKIKDWDCYCKEEIKTSRL
ncbi:S-methyl-5'-thioadenosine phosphorylase [Candidatus Woesearchaeota archaeon]|nr:S-methyl-5'-thioadenosine phosphorylase [Candidatus Woesearchaeota archaeon]